MNRPRRLLYNSDTNHIFHDKGPLDEETLLSFVDEVADSQVTTFLLCQGGQTFFYGSQVGEYRGENCGPETRAAWNDRRQVGVTNLEQWLEQGIEPFDLLVDRIHAHGMEALFSFRLNEGHTTPVDSANVANFWREHPEWRLSQSDPAACVDKYGPDDVATRCLNYAVPEVRARRLAEIREGLARFDFDGLELDFQRWPLFFRDGEREAGIPVMNQFVADVRQMVDEVAATRGRPLSLGVRVLPSLASSRAVGLDPLAWHAAGHLDFLVVTNFFLNRDLFKGKGEPLAIGEYRAALPGLPIYGCIEPVQESAADAWRAYMRARATELWTEGVDGIYLFNLFTSRHRPDAQFEPPFDLLQELGDPGTIR